MGYHYSKRPIRIAELSTLRCSVPVLDVGRVQADERKTAITANTTAGSTAGLASAGAGIGPRGVVTFASTSTKVTAVFVLATPASSGGEYLTIVADSVPTSSAVKKFYTSTTADGVTVGATSADAFTLSSHGASIRLIAKNSSHWYVVGGNGFSLSSSTG